MASPKETYALTVKCTMCNFQVTHEVKIEPEDLIKVKTEIVKQAASIHKAHSYRETLWYIKREIRRDYEWVSYSSQRYLCLFRRSFSRLQR